MKRIGISVMTLLAILVTFSLLRGAVPAYAQADESMGWLEGTVKDEHDVPLGGWHVTVYNSDGAAIISTESDKGAGGLYTHRNIKPGVYEVRIQGGQNVGERGLELRQQRVWGVVINKGVRSVLNIKLKEGKSREYEEIGNPNVPTQPVMLMTEEIERLKAQIAELKKAIEDLKK